MKRLLLVSDTWSPDVNGVVRTMKEMVRHARRRGLEVRILHPGHFQTVPCPTDGSIRLSTFPTRRLADTAERFRPHAIHIATEGPLGVAMRRYCMQRSMPFTTSYCTQFPKYLEERLCIPEEITWKGAHWFHRAATRVFVSTTALEEELQDRGILGTVLVPRGVDRNHFHPDAARDTSLLPPELLGLPRPWFLTVGRVSPEKNVEGFLRLSLPGSKIVVGDGLDLARLKRNFPRASFLGTQTGETLAALYASADVFVFPSRTDTFGLVMLEALASGTPVAATPSQAPKAVLRGCHGARLDEDLGRACLLAQHLPQQACLEHARKFSWEEVGERFLAGLAWTGSPLPRAIA